MTPYLKRKAIVRAIIAATVVIIAVIGIRGWSSKKKPTDEPPPAISGPKAALTVTTDKPQRTELPIKLTANGNIMAWQEAIIGSEAQGLRLADVRVNVGDTVQAGQVLAVFASDTIQADVAQARANLMEAEANAAKAVNTAARARTLQESGALSALQITQYFTDEQTAKARVNAAKAMLAAQQARLKQTEVRAPDSGTISARNATVGAVVGSGAELFRMLRQNRLEWRAEVTSSELSYLASGTTAKVVAANGVQLIGKVRTTAPTVDQRSRTALVYVDLPPISEKNIGAKAGMFAKGEFDLGANVGLTLPQQGVVLRDGFQYVFLLRPDHRVSQVKVRTGRRLQDAVEIIDGIDANAEVVVSGAGFLNDGDLVQLADPSKHAKPAITLSAAEKANRPHLQASTYISIFEPTITASAK